MSDDAEKSSFQNNINNSIISIILPNNGFTPDISMLKD